MKNSAGMAMKLLAIYVLMACFATTISLFGQLLDPIRSYYDITIEQANTLLSAQSVGGVFIAVISILYIDSLNQRKIIALAGIMLAVALISMSVLPLFMVFWLIFISIGLSTGLINILSNSVLVNIATTNKQRFLTILHMVFSLWAFVMPFIAQSLYESIGLGQTLLIIGGAILICCAFTFSVFYEEIRMPLITDRLNIRHRYREVLKVLRKPGMKQIYLLMVLTSIWQMCTIYNVSGAVSLINGRPVEGAWALSSLFLGMIVSRLLYSTVADRFSQGKVLAIMNTAGAGLWTAAMLVQDVIIKIILIGITAVACGVNFPAIFGASCKIADKNTATASGLVALGYYTAIFVFCPIVGSLSDIFGYSFALLLLVIPLLLVLPLSVLLHRRMRSNETAV